MCAPKCPGSLWAEVSSSQLSPQLRHKVNSMGALAPPCQAGWGSGSGHADSPGCPVWGTWGKPPFLNGGAEEELHADL